MSKLLIDYDDLTKQSVYVENCAQTGDSIYTRESDDSEILKEVERRRQNLTGKLGELNSLGLFPPLLIEKWERKINGENMMKPEHKALYKEFLQSPEARPFIINRGLIR